MFLSKIIETRKLQKCSTGFYLNFPKRIANEMELTGNELFKITMQQDGKIVMERVKL